MPEPAPQMTPGRTPESVKGLLNRIQTIAERRLPALTRQRQAEALPIELHRQRIYIVPTGFGLMFSLLLLVMLTGALNYNNNAALLLTCLVGAASASSMLVAFRNLDGLKLSKIQGGHAFAGQPLELHLFFESRRTRQAIRMDMQGVAHAFALDDQGHADVRLMLPTRQRGWQTLPRLRLWTSWPLGMFRAWSWLHPQSSVLVWPLPEADGPAPHAPANDTGHMRIRQGDELSSLREYRMGDPQRHIAWKSSARHGNLLVKNFDQPEARPQWQLDWRQLHGMENEARIARIARWLCEANGQQQHYSLRLPEEDIRSGSGPLHYVRCMNALAQLP